MAWKCSLELTHVYNIYCGNTPFRAPRLRRSIRSHNPLWDSAKHTPRGEGRYGLIYCREEIRRFENPQHTLYDARYRHVALPTDPARRNIGSPVISLGSLSVRPFFFACVCLRFFSFRISARAPVPRKHGDVRRRHVDFFSSPSPLAPSRGNTFLDHH